MGEHHLDLLWLASSDPSCREPSLYPEYSYCLLLLCWMFFLLLLLLMLMCYCRQKPFHFRNFKMRFFCLPPQLIRSIDENFELPHSSHNCTIYTVYTWSKNFFNVVRISDTALKWYSKYLLIHYLYQLTVHIHTEMMEKV